MVKQTTLFQTWGYEGNMGATQNSTSGTQNRRAGDSKASQASSTGNKNTNNKGSGNPENDNFSDDEEFAAAMAQSLQELDSETSQIVGGPASKTPVPSRQSSSLVSGTPVNQNWRAAPSSAVQAATPPHFSGIQESTPGSSSRTRQVPLETIPGFDTTAGTTWIYPTNKSFRQYQFDIVKSCLFDNTLVCLPTGLGKTFIAAVVMYNFYRWYPQGKIVFMAPTKPLVAQQIEACFNTMGIPQSDCIEMTGSVSVQIRQKAWTSKRVFFLTPQVMSNDMARGLFPAREVKLLVVDEAHKAQGEYAYCQVARELFRSQAVTRILALSATPGNDLQAVKAVLQNLYISHIELRHEESPDVLPYTNQRDVQKIVVGLGEELQNMKTRLLTVMEIYTKRLHSHRALRQGHNPTTYSKFSILKSRDEWRQNPPGGITPAVRGVVEGDFAVAMSLYHGFELLIQHGMRPFYNFFTKKDEGDMSSKRINQSLSRIPAWSEMLGLLSEKYSSDSQHSMLNQSRIHLSQQPQQGVKPEENKPKIAVSHPKIEKLIEVVLQHFETFKSKGMDTRVMIFSQYRDSVHEVVGCLSEYSPTIKPMAFIGQAGAVGKKGLTQKEQIEVISRFRSGGYNTLVATCVGEEGLDIGEVDLIVLFDVSKSPIRLVQRMGRTGRKRAGRIVVLVTEGVEERKYNQSLISKKTINKALLERNKLVHALYQNCPRMVPRGLDPVCLQMKMVTEQFKAPVSSGHSRKFGERGAASKKGGKYDVFRQNCGFLTDTEQERWSEVFSSTSSSKRLKDRFEHWTGDRLQEESDSRIDLSDYALWNVDEAHRMYVSKGALTSTYTKIRDLVANKSDLKAKAQEMSKNIKEKQAPSQQAEARNVPASRQAITKQAGDKSRGKGAAITNFFRPASQSSTTSEQLETSRERLPQVEARKKKTNMPQIQEEVLVLSNSSDEGLDNLDLPGNADRQPHGVIQHIIDEDLIVDDGVHDVCEVESKEVREEIVDEYKDLLDDLLDDSDQDSGIELSLPDFQIDIDKVLAQQEDFQDCSDAELLEAWEKSKNKFRNQFLFSSRMYQHPEKGDPMQVFPVRLDFEKSKKSATSTNQRATFKSFESDNENFSEDDMFGDYDQDIKNDNIAGDKNDAVDDMDLDPGSPVIEKKQKSSNQQQLLSQADISRCFDLDSPEILASQESSPEKAAGSSRPPPLDIGRQPAAQHKVSDEFDLGSPEIDDLNFDSPFQEGQSMLSSPTKPVGFDKDDKDDNESLVEISPPRGSPTLHREVSPPRRSRRPSEEDLETSPIIPRSQSLPRDKFTESRLISGIERLKDVAKTLETSTPKTVQRQRSRLLINEPELTPIKEKKDVEKEALVNSPVLVNSRSKVLTLRKKVAAFKQKPTFGEDESDLDENPFAIDDILSEYSPFERAINKANEVAADQEIIDNKQGQRQQQQTPLKCNPDPFGDSSFELLETGDQQSAQGGQIHGPGIASGNLPGDGQEQDPFADDDDPFELPEDGGVGTSGSRRLSSGSGSTDGNMMLGATALVSLLNESPMTQRRTGGRAGRGVTAREDMRVSLAKKMLSRSDEGVDAAEKSTSGSDTSSDDIIPETSALEIKPRRKVASVKPQIPGVDLTPTANFDLDMSEDMFAEDLSFEEDENQEPTEDANNKNVNVPEESDPEPSVIKSPTSRIADKSSLLSTTRSSLSTTRSSLSATKSSLSITKSNLLSDKSSFSTDSRSGRISISTASSLSEWDRSGKSASKSGFKSPRQPSSSHGKEMEAGQSSAVGHPAVVSTCPICGSSVPGAEGGPEINAHIDACLSKDMIAEFSQQPLGTAQPAGQMDSPATETDRFNIKKRKLFDTPSGSPFQKKLKTSVGSSSLVNKKSVQKAATSAADLTAATSAADTSDDDSPVLGVRKRSRAQVLATQDPGLNSLMDSDGEDVDSSRTSNLKNQLKTSDNFTDDNSDFEEQIPGRKKSAVQMSDSEDDSFIKPAAVQRKCSKTEGRKSSKSERKKSSGAQFLDYEAEESGSDISEDEAESEDRDAYDESFVDNATQHHDPAMYLRSIRDDFRRPVAVPARRLPPITADIYSQAPEQDSSYAEDSFVVGSDEEVEYMSGEDTLDILEDIQDINRREAKTNRGKRRGEKEKETKKKIKRIVRPADDDDTDEDYEAADQNKDAVKQTKDEIDNKNKQTVVDRRRRFVSPEGDSPEARGSVGNVPKRHEASVGQQKNKCLLNKTGSLSSLPNKDRSKQNTESVAVSDSVSVLEDHNLDESSFICVKPDVSNSAARMQEMPCIIIASTEINKIPSIISSLKHNHGINVLMKQSNVPFILSTRMCAIRLQESDFSQGTYRKQLEERLNDFRNQYDKCVFIVEQDKARGRSHSKIHLLTLAQLAATKVQIFYSVNKEYTSSILAELVKREDSKGMGIPRSKLSLSQEDMVKVMLKIPGIGLSLAMKLSSVFPKLKSIFLATPQSLVEKTGMSRTKADSITSFLTSTFTHDQDELLPL